ncbi:hypothetical protein ABFS83_12G005000 [Erythranthe nasuta]
MVNSYNLNWSTHGAQFSPPLSSTSLLRRATVTSPGIRTRRSSPSTTIHNSAAAHCPSSCLQLFKTDAPPPQPPELPHLRRSFFRRRGSIVVKLVESRDVIVVQLHVDRLRLSWGFLDEARNVFDEMPVRSSITWSTMVSGYAFAEAGEPVFRCIPIDVRRRNK